MKLVEWLYDHPYVMAYLASAALNSLLRFKSADEWVKFGEKWPAVAAFVRVSRALGVDPVKAINALRSMLESKAEEPKCSDAGERRKKRSTQPTDDVAGPAKYKNPRDE